MSATTEENYVTPSYTINAIVHAGLLTAYHTFGYYWAVYGLIGFMFLPAAIVLVAYGFIASSWAIAKTSSKGRKIKRNLTLQFFTQLITGVSIYTVYQAGFIFLSGFFAFFLISMLFSTFFTTILGNPE